MFTPNERTILDYLHRTMAGDLAAVAAGCNIARSSAHFALQHLGELGVVMGQKSGGRTIYRIAERDELERRAQQLLTEFRSAVLPPRTGGPKPRLAFTDSYVLPEEMLTELREHYEVASFPHAESFSAHDDFLGRAADADVIVRFDFPTIDRATLRRLPELQVIVCPNCYLVDIDVEACSEFGVTVWHPDPGSQKYYSTTQDEFAVNAVLSFLNPLVQATDPLEYDWSASMSRDLFGRRVGIIAESNGARRLSEVFRSLGCQVRTTDTGAGEPSAIPLGAHDQPTVNELWEWSEVCVMMDGAVVDLGAVLDGTRHAPELVVTMSSTLDVPIESVVHAMESGFLKTIVFDMVPNAWRHPEHIEATRAGLERLDSLPGCVFTPEMSIISEGSMQRSYRQVHSALIDIARQLH